MRWDTAPLWSQVVPAGRKVSPDAVPGQPEVVAHYAIDELGASGEPRSESPDEIASDKLLVQAGDILVSRLNPRRGHVFRVAGHEEPAIASTEFAVVCPRPVIDPCFVDYVLRSEPTRRALDSQVRSATKSHGRVEFEAIWSLPVPVPPLEEQRRIASYLDTETARIDTLLTKNTEAAALVEERFWATVEERVWPRSAPRTRLGTLAESMVDGPFGSSLASKHYVDEGPRVVRLGNIGRARFLDHDIACIEHSHYSELLGHRVLAGDLVVASLGDSSSHAPAGRAAVIPGWLGDAIVKADCHRVRLSRKAFARFFAWQLSSPRSVAEASSLARGSTRPRLNLTLNGERTVAVPSLPEQQEIASVLDRLWDETRELSERMSHQRELLSERRQALITAAVTGEIEV